MAAESASQLLAKANELLATCTKKELKATVLPLLSRVLALAKKDTDCEVQCLLKRATVYGRLHLFHECLADASRIITLEPDNLAGYNIKGRSLFHLGDVAQAVVAFKQGLGAAARTKMPQAQAPQVEALRKALDKCAQKLPAEDTRMARFPSTPHLPFSPQVNDDDIQMSASGALPLIGRQCVVTEKLDGGNCCLFQGKVYARTHGHEATHPSFGPIKSLSATLSPSLVQNRHLALFGETMCAVHSIEYDGLSAYFYLFAVFDTRVGLWLSWAEVESTAALLGLEHVPVMFKGVFKSVKEMQRYMETNAKQPSAVGRKVTPEGFVVRLAAAFSNEVFPQSCGKYVRKGHVQTKDDWRRTWKKAVVTPKVEQDLLSETPRESPAKLPSLDAPVLSAKEKKHALKEAKQLAKQLKSRTKRAPKFLLLVGLPCSGKSTFARQLAEAESGWAWVSKDDLGSRSLAQKAVADVLLGKGKKRHGSSASHCVLDMCNVTPQDRKSWLASAMTTPKDAAAVWFDVSADECKQRAAKRTGHATGDLFSWGGAKIIDSHAKKLQPPAVGEGFGQVFTVRGWKDMNALLAKLGGKTCAPELQQPSVSSISTGGSSSTTGSNLGSRGSSNGRSVSNIGSR
jgi:predicted kinase